MTTNTLERVGPAYTPRHEDGSLVITARLWERLSPWEKAVLSGPEMYRHLAARAYSWLRESVVDGWGADDLVSYALILQGRYPDVSPGVLTTWMRQEFTRRTKADRTRPCVQPVPLETYSSAEDEKLPEEVAEWVRLHVSNPRIAEAIIHVSEGDWSVARAAEDAGVTPRAVYYALAALRKPLDSESEQE